MTPKKFYQNYLAMNKPVFVMEGASDWLAMSKWKDEKYLADQTKRTQAYNADWEFQNQRQQVTTVETEQEIKLWNTTIERIK